MGVAGGCKICTFPLEFVQEINAAIWDGQRRVKGGMANAERMLKDGRHRAERKTIYKHANHTEESWRVVTGQHPVAPDEIPVFPIDFESVVDRMAQLGMYAASKLEQRVKDDEIDARDLAGVTRMGLGAVVERQKAADRSKRPNVQVTAIFGVVSGHLRDSDGAVRNVTPLNELLAELDTERALLMGGDEPPDLDDVLGT